MASAGRFRAAAAAAILVPWAIAAAAQQEQEGLEENRMPPPRIVTAGAEARDGLRERMMELALSRPPAPQKDTEAPASEEAQVPAGEITAPEGGFDAAQLMEAAPSAEEILQRADEVRNPQLDYIVTVDVVSTKPDGEEKRALYEVYVKGRENTLVKTLEPARERDRILLMRGRDLWAYLPTVSKPLRISLRERLIGDVANGDLARTNFSGDYAPTLERVDVWEPRSAHYVLKLDAVSRDVTYAAVTLWVEIGTFRPARAEFFALSGKLLKSCRYLDYREMAGRQRPSRLVMEDAAVSGQFSTLTYTEMRLEEIPEKYFTKQYLKRMVD